MIWQGIFKRPRQPLSRKRTSSKRWNESFATNFTRSKMLIRKSRTCCEESRILIMKFANFRLKVKGKRARWRKCIGKMKIWNLSLIAYKCSCRKLTMTRSRLRNSGERILMRWRQLSTKLSVKPRWSVKSVATSVKSRSWSTQSKKSSNCQLAFRLSQLQRPSRAIGKASLPSLKSNCALPMVS